ncbi:coiled-coil domain-containing protein [Micromonospora sp. NPDC093277]|uniref:coiled-coil domain-containing protein n=1 Tax=Micromonospora sp. NPDC093277 TaxID=3364291 RepID=UPI0037F79EC2
MPRIRLIRRRVRRPLLALLAVAALLLGAGLAPAGTAVAAPTPSAPDEGGSKQLRQALEAAAKGHIEATARLDNSKRRQTELNTQLKQLELRLVELNSQVGEVAAQSYRLGRMTPVSALLASSDPGSFLQRAAELDVMAQRDSKRLRALNEAKTEAAQAKLAIDAEIREQQKQLAILAKKKRDAEMALAKVSSGGGAGFSGSSASAKPAPRNSDGSWPSESCSVNDPTTSGCITPRTLHMVQQAKAANYKRYVSCFRSGGDGEHPKGRACDFSAATGGFENVSATGGDRSYGDSLANYLKNNASKLGVMYVIWYRQIWMPNTGWRSYSGGGTPAGDHTNHVHVSMY